MDKYVGWRWTYIYISCSLTRFSNSVICLENHSLLTFSDPVPPMSYPHSILSCVCVPQQWKLRFSQSLNTLNNLARKSCVCVCLQIIFPVHLQQKVLRINLPGQRTGYCKFRGRLCQTATRRGRTKQRCKGVQIPHTLRRRLRCQTWRNRHPSHS